jgi:predicted nucleic acid-binding protein
LAFLIDTCVLSESSKRRPNDQVVAWLDSIEESLIHLSVLTLGEFYKGIAKLNDSRKRERLQSWVDDELAGRFRGRVLSIDERVANLWGKISGEAEKKGKRLPVIDGLIGATALVHGLTVASRNTADIARTGARVFNPWI